MVLKVARIAGAAFYLAGVSAPALAQSAATAAPAPGAAAAKTNRPSLIPTSDFTQQSGLEKMSLSPDGNHIALKATPKDGKVHLAVLDASTRALQHNLMIPEKNTIEWFRWAGNHRVLLSLSQLGKIYDTEVRFTRLFVYDLDAKTFTLVGKDAMGIDGDDLVYVDPQGDYALLSIQRDVFDYPAVWRFPLDGTANKNGKVVQGAKRRVWNWVADDAGVIRMGFQFTEWAELKVLYRRTAADDFKTIATMTEEKFDEDLWDVVRIVSDSEDGYVLKENDAGQVVLRKYNYAAHTAGEVVYTAPDGWDVTDVELDDSHKPLSVSFTDEHDRKIWFDPKMNRLQARMEKALPNETITIASRARDGSRMLVWAGSENDPGTIYVYTDATGHLDALVGYKPALDVAQLPKPRPIDYQARDGTKIHAYLTLPPGRAPKNLPLIIMPHGGPYGIRDQLEFDTEVQFLANRGYAVLQPNYRGSGGYGDRFEKLGDGQIGRKMQDDLDDAMDWAAWQGYADPKRVCVVGASYGGYAALWAVTRNPERYRCAASFAGVTDWNKQLRYDRNFFSSYGANKWKNRVRGEAKGFNLDDVSPVVQAARLTRPVLLAHGEDDSRVPFNQFKMMRDAAAKEGKQVELLTFKDEGHGFDKQEDETKWLDTLEAFLTRYNPAD
jgi:dipeptidyl aminopeptidase/acylaminoacyl peptidase